MKRVPVAAVVLFAAVAAAGSVARASRNAPAVLDLQPQSTFATGGDERGAPGGVPLTNGDLRLPFKLTIPVAQKLSFVFAHKNIDETLGRVAQADGTYTHPGAYHGDANDASVSYTAGADTWSAGYLQRHRACCPYDKVQEHLAYAGFENDFGPVSGKKSLFAFKLQALRSVTNGGPAIYRTSLQLRAPVAKGFRVLSEAGVDSDYFDGQPIPLYYNYVNYGIQTDFSPAVSYTMLVENLTQRRQGYPFVSPNAIHRAKIVLQADFKVPF
jgi:hypothetical protein